MWRTSWWTWPCGGWVGLFRAAFIGIFGGAFLLVGVEFANNWLTDIPSIGYLVAMPLITCARVLYQMITTRFEDR
jgi:hypothetical protein